MKSLLWLLRVLLFALGALALGFTCRVHLARADESAPLPPRPCYSAADLDKHLAGAGYERGRSLVSRRGWVLTVYAASDGRWQVVRTMPSGCAAVVDLGGAWFRPTEDYL